MFGGAELSPGRARADMLLPPYKSLVRIFSLRYESPPLMVLGNK